MPFTQGKQVFKLALLASIMLFAPLSHAANDAGEQVMRQVYDQFRQKPNQRAEVKLTIEDKSGSQRVRYFRSLYKILPERSKSLIKFYNPPSVRGTGLLSESEEDSNEASLQWLYLPALKSVKQLSGGDRHKSFMGSDFTHADLAGRQVGQDSHEIIAKHGKITRIRSIPHDDEDIYGRIESDILSAIHVPRRVVFYDRQGKKLKTLTNQELRKINGMYVVMRARMDNHRTGGHTKMEKENVNVEREISLQDVGFKGLRR